MIAERLAQDAEDACNLTSVRRGIFRKPAPQYLVEAGTPRCG
jgi:hypothetical protein